MTKHGLGLGAVVLLIAAAVFVGSMLADRAAGQPGVPMIYEYKTVGFRVEVDQNPAGFNDAFTRRLNVEAEQGWEYVGPCARREGPDYSVDYVVFRRRKI